MSDNIHSVFDKARRKKSPVLAIVTEQSQFLQAGSTCIEAVKEKLPVIVVDTGQHFDEILRFGIEEFNLQKFVGYALRYVET